MPQMASYCNGFPPPAAARCLWGKQPGRAQMVVALSDKVEDFHCRVVGLLIMVLIVLMVPGAHTL
jgi:hypothetical protein